MCIQRHGTPAARSTIGGIWGGRGCTSGRLPAPRAAGVAAMSLLGLFGLRASGFAWSAPSGRLLMARSSQLVARPPAASLASHAAALDRSEWRRGRASTAKSICLSRGRSVGQRVVPNANQVRSILRTQLGNSGPTLADTTARSGRSRSKSRANVMTEFGAASSVGPASAKFRPRSAEIGQTVARN